MTIKDPMNRTLYKTNKVYMHQSTDSLNNAMVYDPIHKVGIVRDTNIQPCAAKTETFEAPIPDGIGKIRVNVDLSYQPRPGDVYPIHHKIVELDPGK